MYFHYCRCWVMFLLYHHQRWISWTNFVNLEHSTEILITSLDNMEDILVFNQMVSCLCLVDIQNLIKLYETVITGTYYILQGWDAKLKGPSHASRTWHLKFEKDNFLQFNKKSLYSYLYQISKYELVIAILISWLAIIYELTVIAFEMVFND